MGEFKIASSINYWNVSYSTSFLLSGYNGGKSTLPHVLLRGRISSQNWMDGLGRNPSGGTSLAPVANTRMFSKVAQLLPSKNIYKITSKEYCNDLITACYSTKLPISATFRLSLLSQSWRKSLQCIMTISSRSLCLVPSSEYEGTKMPSIVDEIRGDWPWQKTHSNNFGWLRISYKTFKFARPSLNCSRADRTLSITK